METSILVTIGVYMQCCTRFLCWPRATPRFQYRKKNLNFRLLFVDEISDWRPNRLCVTKWAPREKQTNLSFTRGIWCFLLLLILPLDFYFRLCSFEFLVLSNCCTSKPLNFCTFVLLHFCTFVFCLWSRKAVCPFFFVLSSCLLVSRMVCLLCLLITRVAVNNELLAHSLVSWLSDCPTYLTYLTYLTMWLYDYMNRTF